MAEQVRIAEGTTVTAASVGVWEDTERVCPRSLAHLEACGKNRGSMCCRALCGCEYGTWMLQDYRTNFISQQTSLLRKDGPMRSAEWSQEVEKAKAYWIGTN